MNEEPFIVYEYNSYDMIRTWRSLSYQPIDFLDIRKSQARMSEVIHMMASPVTCKMRLFPRWQLKDDF